MSNLIEPLSDAAVEGYSHRQMHKVPTRAPPGGCIPGPMQHRAGHHISLDVFKISLVERDGQAYDQLYEVTDVVANIAIAAPTLSVGIDSQRAVEVLWDSWIYPFGIPVCGRMVQGALQEGWSRPCPIASGPTPIKCQGGDHGETYP